MGRNVREIGVPAQPLDALPSEWVIEHQSYRPHDADEDWDGWFTREELRGRRFTLLEGFAMLRVLKLQEHGATMRLRNDITNETLQYQS